jgi:hypothetical protein
VAVGPDVDPPIYLDPNITGTQFSSSIITF